MHHPSSSAVVRKTSIRAAEPSLAMFIPLISSQNSHKGIVARALVVIVGRRTLHLNIEYWKATCENVGSDVGGGVVRRDGWVVA